MFDAPPGNTTEQYAPLADSAAHNCRGEQKSSRPTDARDSAASRHHAIPGRQCTPRCSTAFAAGSAMSTPDASVTVDATTGIMWSPVRQHHPTPASKIGFSTATPHKTALQIMAPARRFGDRCGPPLGVIEAIEASERIGLHDTDISGEMFARMIASAVA